ncbi:hypothetical protein J3L16_06390 [Alteromonas sp. 5E99-2]|uniref:MaoC/PaaZ C-terminal domain-containing protein n=1 Tax=Alteromonas sp. 5E99-2 TaxID=2817683 RepID=UPI001A998A50|nr:MaoC/PaaZ C-terminal domain-containing protein [Alteromonas sp. 5E99-2]MBO1255314.1 hypothetical protein [Alteromonas sp. 5E99-2]
MLSKNKAVIRVVIKAIKHAIKKKNTTFDAEALSSLRAITITDPYFKVDYRHYRQYEFRLRWMSDFTHPCYLQMLTLPMQLELLTDERCPFNPVGLVHIHNSIVQTPDFELGQPFELSVRFGEVYAHPRGIAVDVVVKGEQESKCVYQATSTYLSRSFHDTDNKLKQASHLPYLRPSPSLVRRDLRPLKFKGSDGRRYAELSGDYNPIHLASVFAKMFGFKQAIIHGMYSLAMVLSVEEEALNFKDSDLPLEIDCDFMKPIYLPSTTQIVTGCINVDRFMSLHDANKRDIVHLLVRYARGEATRLHRRF